VAAITLSGRCVADPPFSFVVVFALLLPLMLEVRDNDASESVPTIGRSGGISFAAQFPIFWLWQVAQRWRQKKRKKNLLSWCLFLSLNGWLGGSK